jgi:putative SOS response-associated peptidase YedK
VDHEHSQREEGALGPDHRCLVPFTSFAECDTIDGKNFFPDFKPVVPPERQARFVSLLS